MMSHFREVLTAEPVEVASPMRARSWWCSVFMGVPQALTFGVFDDIGEATTISDGYLVITDGL